MNLKRGFKAESARRANNLRSELGLQPNDPLYARVLARHMRIPVCTPDKIHGLSLQDLDELLGRGSSNWSAVTVVAPQKPFIIHNASHSTGRQESNIMHELAHLICNHQPSEIIQIDGYAFPLRSCNKSEEEEADWVCGCLKLPREGVLWAVRSGMSTEVIAERFASSIDLARYRIRITGVEKQVQREKQKRQRRM